jgi:YrbI family 3-deoxy-D-manno-octulosonate 8-phosphate phosphatase
MRSHHDGQGINLLRAAGIKVAFITSESNGFLEKFADKLNNSVSVKSGKFDPITVFSGTLGENRELSIGKWLEDMGFSFNDCAYMGDDIGDYLIMKKVFFPVAPKSANKIVKDLSIINIENDGGSGAIREFVDFVLLAKDVDIINFPLK